MSATPGRRLALVIHDLNSWGGQERCTLEVARRLSHRWPVDVYAYTLEDPHLETGWGEVSFHRVRPRLRRPELTKLLYFCGVVAPVLWNVRRRSTARIHTAGACSLVSEIVQIHYVHKAWKAKREELPRDLRLPPRVRSGRGLHDRLLIAYYDFLLNVGISMERLAYSPGKTYIAISRGIARELEEHFGLTRGVHVVRHGVDAAAFRPVSDETRRDREDLRRHLGIMPDEVVALLVGAYERKGLPAAVEALDRLDSETLLKVKLLAVGGGQRARFLEMARSRGLEERLILVGHEKQIARYYRASDLFLFPTLYEPFGMAVLEAMACGLAPIVSRRAGAAELIEPEVSGLLLSDPSDPGEIATAVRRLVMDPEARSRMGRQARTVAERRTWDTVAEEYASVLEPLMEGKAR